MTHVNICGYSVSTLTPAEHTRLLADWAKAKRGQWIVTLNLQMISEGQLDKKFDLCLKQADFFVADGMPLVWISRAKKKPIAGRTTGVDLVADLFKTYPDFRYGIIGGENPELALQVVRYPHPENVFIYKERVSLSEAMARDLALHIQKHNTDILFVALGTPKETYFIKLLQPHLPNTLLIGVGGTFELLSKSKPRAPEWMQNAGLEWLYRLSAEPKRLWRRYLLTYPVGAWRLLRDLL